MGTLADRVEWAFRHYEAGALGRLAITKSVIVEEKRQVTMNYCNDAPEANANYGWHYTTIKARRAWEVKRG